MVDLIDIIVGKILSLIIEILKKIKSNALTLLHYCLDKIKERKKINKKYLRCKSIIIDEKKYNKIKRKKEILNMGTIDAHLTIYKSKKTKFNFIRNNNKRDRT